MGILRKYEKGGNMFLDIEVDLFFVPYLNREKDEIHIIKKIISFVLYPDGALNFESHYWVNYISNQIASIYPNVMIHSVDIKDVEDVEFEYIFYDYVPISLIVYVENYKQFDRHNKINSILG